MTGKFSLNLGYVDIKNIELLINFSYNWLNVTL